MPDYTSNEIINILILEECHNNYRQAAVLYRTNFLIDDIQIIV